MKHKCKSSAPNLFPGISSTHMASWMFSQHILCARFFLPVFHPSLVVSWCSVLSKWNLQPFIHCSESQASSLVPPFLSSPMPRLSNPADFP